MLEADSPEGADFAALHAKKRRFLFALLGNVVLLVVMVGGPFLRGYVRTRSMWSEFGRFGACIYGAKPSAEPALGVPQGSEAHFAARVLQRAPGWPESCQKVLSELSPDEPIFLLPSLKRAELDIRAAAKLVHGELSALGVRVPGERLSVRPLRAIEHLRAALARHASSAGVLDVPETDAFVLTPGAGLPIATRVPLYASSEARISVWGTDSDFHALAVDMTGVSSVRVWNGGMQQQRFPRPKLLEAFLPSAEGGLFVWAMPRARCREKEGGCVQKAMGVAALRLPLSELPKPRWLGAHPAGRIDRSVWPAADRLLVVAEAKEQRREVRELPMPEGEMADPSELPPLAAQKVWPHQALGESLFVELAGQPSALFAENNSEATELTRVSSEGAQSLAKLPAGAEPWLVEGSCAGGDHMLAFGNDRTLALAALSASGELHVWPEQPIPLHRVVDERDPAHDRVRTLCVPKGRALAVLRDDKEGLSVLACDRESNSCRSHALANGVYSFAALSLGERVLVAYAGSRNTAQIRVQTLDARGQTRLAERIPAACWAPTGGLCGTPLLERVGSRLLLGAREGTDMLVLESADDGASWEPLRGLKKGH